MLREREREVEGREEERREEEIKETEGDRNICIDEHISVAMAQQRKTTHFSYESTRFSSGHFYCAPGFA